MAEIPPAPVPPVPSEKKGLPVLGWLGIGCGGLLLIAIAAGIGGVFILKRKIEEFTANPEKMVAETIVGMHPELEAVDRDDAAGTMKIRTKAGEEFTVSYADIAEGKFTYKDSSGKSVTLGASSDMSEIPSWVPRAPDTQGEHTVLNSTGAGKSSGFYQVSSTRTKAELESFFNEEASRLGLEAGAPASFSADGAETTIIGYISDTRTLNLTISVSAGHPALVKVDYAEK